MKYKNWYFDLLFIGSIFYYVCAVLDYLITVNGYYQYGNAFFEMELNPVICFVMKLGFPPAHMLIFPFIAICLIVYLQRLLNKATQNELDNLPTRTVWSFWFATMVLTSIGIIHLIGFYSWFYYGVF